MRNTLSIDQKEIFPPLIDTLKLKLKKFTENLSFVLGVCIENLKIVIHQVSQLVYWFTTACSLMFPYKHRITLQSLAKSRQRKPEVAPDFCV